MARIPGLLCVIVCRYQMSADQSCFGEVSISIDAIISWLSVRWTGVGRKSRQGMAKVKLIVRMRKAIRNERPKLIQSDHIGA